MLDCLLDGLIDTLKLIPYLLVTFLILEFLEHKLNHKNEKYLKKANKFGPLIGALFGALPQCGFSTMAANLFSNGVITTGTLIAIFLSTSDEMLPIMVSEHIDPFYVIFFIGIKVIVAIIAGFIIDFVSRKKKTNTHKEIVEHCKHDECNCKKNGIIKSSIIHTLKITIFVLILNLGLNLVIHFIGEANLSTFLYQFDNNILKYFVASLIGLIPNCASSVLITELYLMEMISIGTMFAGLLTGSGLGILFLFKENKNKKESIKILLTIYFIGVIVGFIIDLIFKYVISI